MLFSLFAALLISLSITLQKSQIREKTKIREMISNKKWILATLLGGLGFLSYLYDISYERLVIAQPILSTSIILAVFFEFLILKRSMNKIELLSCALVFIGIILIGVAQ